MCVEIKHSHLFSPEILMYTHKVTCIFHRDCISTNQANYITLQYLMNKRHKKIPSATIELLEDRLENSSDQLQPLINRNILKTQQNI